MKHYHGHKGKICIDRKIVEVVFAFIIGLVVGDEMKTLEQTIERRIGD